MNLIFICGVLPFFFPISCLLFCSVGGFSLPWSVEFGWDWARLIPLFPLSSSPVPFLRSLGPFSPPPYFWVPITSPNFFYLCSYDLCLASFILYYHSPRSLTCKTFPPALVNILHGVVRVRIFRQAWNILLAVTSMINIGRSQAATSFCLSRCSCTYPVVNMCGAAGSTY